MHQPVHRLSGQGGTDEMHAGLKLRSTSAETLQTASHLRTLFQNGHMVTIFLEDISACEASET